MMVSLTHFARAHPKPKFYLMMDNTVTHMTNDARPGWTDTPISIGHFTISSASRMNLVKVWWFQSCCHGYSAPGWSTVLRSSNARPSTARFGSVKAPSLRLWTEHRFRAVRMDKDHQSGNC